MNSLVTEVLVPRYGLAWYPWAVQYFFLIALSYGALWLSAPGLLGAKNWKATTKVGLLACVSTTLVAPVALLADLHQPLRFWHFYAHPTPWSWMSVGSFMLPLYVGAVVLLGWLVWRPQMFEQRTEPGLQGWVARIVTLGTWREPALSVPLLTLGALFMSLGIMLYTGAEVAVVKGRPLWNTVWLPPMFVVTGLVGACGLIALLNRIAGVNKSSVYKQMFSVMFIACFACGLIAITWYLDGMNDIDSSVAAAIASVKVSATWRNMALWAAVAGVVLTVLAWLISRNYRLQAYGWLVGLLALHVAWMFRWSVLMDVQTIARNSAGFNDYTVALGSSGILGIVGTFGLWLAAILLIEIFVPWRGIEQRQSNPSSTAVGGVASHG